MQVNIACGYKLASTVLQGLNRLQPLWWLFVRIWIAAVFFKSGLTKIDDFSNTIFLFTEEYKVPFVSPYFAAVSGTFFELTCPILLTLGLATRLAVLPLISMTLVIQLTYMDHVQHYYWGIVLTGLLIHGAGKLSLDHLISQRFARCLTTK
jgi:putative oxidoreductase